MTETHKNYGFYSPTVKILNTLPYVDRNPETLEFDINANQIGKAASVDENSSFFTEYISDEDGIFSFIIPSRRKYFIDNFVENKVLSLNKPYVTWVSKNVDFPEDHPIYKSIDKQKKAYGTEAHLDKPEEYQDVNYKGPKWDQIPLPYIAPNDEYDKIRSVLESLEIVAKAPEAPKGDEAATKNLAEKTYWLQQRTSSSGLIWATETEYSTKESAASEVYNENFMPIWINITRKLTPTSVPKFLGTFICITIGTDEDNKFDLVLQEESKPYIVDRKKDASGKYFIKEFDVDTAKIITSQENIEIGVLQAGSSIFIFVNQVTLEYKRMGNTSTTETPASSSAPSTQMASDKGKIIPLIPSPTVKITGNNISCLINLCPMTSVAGGIFPIMIPESSSWKGVDNHIVATESTGLLPLDPSSNLPTAAGAICKTYKGDYGTHQGEGLGTVIVKKMKQSGQDIKSKNISSYVGLVPNLQADLNGWPVPYWGFPYFLRIKGKAFPEPKEASGSEGEDVTADLISLDESFDSNDWHSISKSANITLYNPNGRYQRLLSGQKGVKISWGPRDGVSENSEGAVATFTGVVISYQVNEKAGMETITLTCKDYMFVLENSLIINSAYYDGMVCRYAVEDLAKKAGITDFIVNWENEDEYFLSSAPNNIQNALYRWENGTSYLEAIRSVLQKDEAFIHFDGDGKLNITKVPGGIVGDLASASTVGDYYQDPTQDKDLVIIGDMAVTVDLASTVNQITLISVDRETNNPIVEATKSDSSNILFKRTFFWQQPAFGSINVAKAEINEKKIRLFNPILKVSISNTGINTDLLPYQYINVKDQPFRVMSLKRSYNAESNDAKQELTGEYMGPTIEPSI